MKLLEAELELQTERGRVLVVSCRRWSRQPFVRAKGKPRRVPQTGSPAGTVRERIRGQANLWFDTVLLVYLPRECERQKTSLLNLYQLLQTLNSCFILYKGEFLNPNIKPKC